MANILHIETSTDICSVALSRDGQIVFHQEEREGPNHAKSLAPMVEQAVKTANAQGYKLDAVAVSAGPGSYTGLRIGTSTAKGLCYGRGLKLIGIPTLELLCVPVLLGERFLELCESEPEADILFCPMLDARRMEVYTALYDRALRPKSEVAPLVVDEQSLASELATRKIVFFGNGAAKCKSVITHPNAIFIDHIEPIAKNMMPLAEKAFYQGRTEETAYFEPFYLKEFVAGKSKSLLPQDNSKNGVT